MYEYVTKPTGAHSWPTMKLYVKGDRSQVTYMHAEPTQPSWAYNMFSKISLPTLVTAQMDLIRTNSIRNQCKNYAFLCRHSRYGQEARIWMRAC